MECEKERRFLVGKPLHWRNVASESIAIEQGYVLIENGRILRVRTMDVNGIKSATWGYKGTPTDAGTPEFEQRLSLVDAATLLKQCGTRVLRKARYRIKHGHLTFEVDVFRGNLEPLIIAEVELATMNEPLGVPCWCDEEITGRHEYSNATLAVKGLPDHFYAWRHTSAKHRRTS